MGLFKFTSISKTKLNAAVDLRQLYEEFREDNLYNPDIIEKSIDDYFILFFMKITARCIFLTEVSDLERNHTLKKLFDFCFESICQP